MMFPKIGQVWEQRRGEFKGRRGVVVSIGAKIVIDPYPGTCPCPLKQRRTSIKADNFLYQFRLYSEEAKGG